MIELIRDNRWIAGIILADVASPATEALANELRIVLSQMAGYMMPISWPYQNRWPSPSICIGLYSEWFGSQAPGLWATPPYVPDADYAIIAGQNEVRILARDHDCLASAVWEFAWSLGYRMLTPTPGWEVIPKLKAHTSSINIVRTVQIPTFVQGLGDAGGVMPVTALRLAKWRTRNGLNRSQVYRYGHAWGEVLAENINLPHSSVGNKLFVRDPSTRAAAVAYAKARAKIRDVRWVSMAASDGLAGWSEVLAVGQNASDAQIELANHVQEALDMDSECNGARVAIQAYGATSIRPMTRLNPRIVVIAMTAYIQDGRIYDDVVADYVGAGATDVIPYIYESVTAWNHGAVGHSRAAQIDLSTLDVSRVLDAPGSIRALACEGDSSWAMNGRGYWSIVQRISDRYDGFEEYAFDVPMSEFYKILATPDALTPELVARMYALLRTALTATSDSSVRIRLYDLVSYTRYTELLRGFNAKPSTMGIDALLEWMYRIRDRDLVNFKGAYDDPVWRPWITKRVAELGIPALSPWTAPPPGWVITPPTQRELDKYLGVL